MPGSEYLVRLQGVLSLFQSLGGDLREPLTQANQQGRIAQVVDAAGHSCRKLPDQFLASGSKAAIIPRTGFFQPVFHILPSFKGGKGGEKPVDIDALAQWPEFRQVEAVAQFVLPHQENLQKLAFRRFNIIEESDMFQAGIGEQVGFIYNEKEGFPPVVGCN